ncbi:ShlB/FhaC/HecB family hemolysin secretion/activation protein [Marinobacter sp. MDS2]|uniref:ShlB/FhaC/HecB family hemolysin secretion/activation protein n=1 Tax=Marinobacter sp. MDS2 TaxID=3065961 RepID=UPI00273CBF28|nr:ShlB/FhaC/HecB family hemolysin secretion/activation protein [Marinobacter sp. MDS2]MDP4547809.1 ShlB/FhaC/HecB family hemolysin secretion/activation protein [Marinobacter sp. MDS2]
MDTHKLRNMAVHALLLLAVLILPTADASAEEPVLGAVVFEGVSAFSTPQLIPLYANSLGEPITPQLKTGLHTRFRGYYLEQGFLSPAVTIRTHPDSVHILIAEITEPRIAEIRITGGTEDLRNAVRDRLAPLRQRVPISQHDIERFNRTLEKAVRVGLAATIDETSPGQHRIAYTLKPEIHGELTYSAEGSQTLGQHMVAGKLRVTGLGAGIREIYLFGLHTLESSGYRNLGAGLSYHATDTDTVYADVSSSRAVPQGQRIRPEREYERIWSQVRWRHRVLDSTSFTLSLDSSLILRDYTRERGNDTEVDEQLRMASLGALAYAKSTGNLSRFGVSGRVGVDNFGAKRSGSRANDSLDLDFQILHAFYTLWQELPADFSLKLDLSGQYSSDNLPYSQRFSIGGSNIALAYEPGEFSGDSGLGSKLELRRGFSSEQWIPGSRWVPYAYYGVARAFQNQSGDRESGAAAGAGLRFLNRKVSAYIEMGKPLTTASAYKDKDLRLTGRLTTYF